MIHKSGPVTYIFAFIAVIGLFATGFLTMRTLDQETVIKNQADRITALQGTIAARDTTILSLETDLGNLKNDLLDIVEDYQDEKERNEEFEDQLMDLAGELDEFERLNEIDEELLAKYSKVSFLNENYVPSSIKQIDPEFVLEGKDDQYFHGDAMRYLDRMFEAAKRDDIDLKIVSGYRSFDEQREVKNGHTTVFGAGANAFSADQGFSEHQLGTTIDITTPEIGGTFQSFGDTEAFAWLQDNAHKYGFILSYPEGNTFYIYEPWHWRFVGRDLARDLDRDDERTFYTMDQREINKYLLEFFD